MIPGPAFWTIRNHARRSIASSRKSAGRLPPIRPSHSISASYELGNRRWFLGSLPQVAETHSQPSEGGLSPFPGRSLTSEPAFSPLGCLSGRLVGSHHAGLPGRWASRSRHDHVVLDRGPRGV